MNVLGFVPARGGSKRDTLESCGERYDAAYSLTATSLFRSAATIADACRAFQAGGTA